MDRFTVKQRNLVFWVKDNMGEKYHLPDMAVNIYFKFSERPQVICNILNAEWREFEKNPD